MGPHDDVGVRYRDGDGETGRKRRKREKQNEEREERQRQETRNGNIPRLMDKSGRGTYNERELTHKSK